MHLLKHPLPSEKFNLDLKLDVGFKLPSLSPMSMKFGFSCPRIGLMPIPIHFKEI